MTKRLKETIREPARLPQERHDDSARKASHQFNPKEREAIEESMSDVERFGL